MTDAKRSWDLLSDETRKKAIKEIIAFFQTERDEEIGQLAADSLLDFFIEKIGPQLYNQGIDDAKDSLRKEIENIEVEMDILKKRT